MSSWHRCVETCGASVIADGRVLYGAGAETLILVTQCLPRKPRKINI